MQIPQQTFHDFFLKATFSDIQWN